MLNEYNSLFRLLPVKQKILADGRINLDSQKISQLQNDEMKRLIINYVTEIANNYNNGMYDIDEYIEIKKMFLISNYTFLADYSDYIFAMLDMKKAKQTSLMKKIAKAGEDFIGGNNFPTLAIVNLIFEIMKEHERLLRNIIKNTENLMGYQNYFDSDYLSSCKIVEDNLEILHYLIDDVSGDKDDFYKDIANVELEKRYAALLKIDEFGKLIELLEKNNVKVILNILIDDERRLQRELENIKNNPSFQYHKTVIDKKAKIRGIYNNAR